MRLQEKTLTRLCVGTSLIGIALIFAISLIAEPPEIDIAHARDFEKAKFSGVIMSVELKDSHVALKVAGHGAIDAVSFDAETVKNLGLQKFQEVEIVGEVRQFNERKTIIISKIKASGSACNSSWQGENHGHGD